jgi:hypothetical protein
MNIKYIIYSLTNIIFPAEFPMIDFKYNCGLELKAKGYILNPLAFRHKLGIYSQKPTVCRITETL